MGLMPKNLNDEICFLNFNALQIFEIITSTKIKYPSKIFYAGFSPVIEELLYLYTYD